ncbi:hypothetical protein DVH05_009499 [Phytophthora capsici]|nr:hypothetical protein DVH05_009499 [Phytophthora capsici]
MGSYLSIVNNTEDPWTCKIEPDKAALKSLEPLRQDRNCWSCSANCLSSTGSSPSPKYPPVL